jgi:hypothetical protein
MLNRSLSSRADVRSNVPSGKRPQVKHLTLPHLARRERIRVYSVLR